MGSGAILKKAGGQVVSEDRARKWMWLGLLMFFALQMYFVQEMLAALILFSVTFLIFVTGALVLYVVDRAGQWSLGWVGEHTRSAAQLGRRGWAAAEAVSRRPFHRPRSETAP